MTNKDGFKDDFETKKSASRHEDTWTIRSDVSRLDKREVVDCVDVVVVGGYNILPLCNTFIVDGSNDNAWAMRSCIVRGA